MKTRLLFRAPARRPCCGDRLVACSSKSDQPDLRRFHVAPHSPSNPLLLLLVVRTWYVPDLVLAASNDHPGKKGCALVNVNESVVWDTTAKSLMLKFISCLVCPGCCRIWTPPTRPYDLTTTPPSAVASQRLLLGPARVYPDPEGGVC